jgi:hypothetical protein
VPRKILFVFHFVKSNGISKIKICVVVLCIFIVRPIFMYSYCYVRSVLGILFHCVVLCIVCV